MRVENCKRVVLFDYDAESQKVQLRHYLITSHSIGVSKSVKRILQKKLPNLSELRDISQYVLGYDVLLAMLVDLSDRLPV